MIPLELKDPTIDLERLSSEASLLNMEHRLMVLAQDTQVTNRHGASGEWFPNWEADRASLREQAARYFERYARREHKTIGSGVTLIVDSIGEGFKRWREQVTDLLGVETYMAYQR